LIFKDIEELKEEELASFYKKVGSNVKALRKKHGISQMQLSQMLNHKSTSLVSGAEVYYNKQHFWLEHLFYISYVFNEPIENLLK
jgi:ribosome-binding protein aMBF1 (putative translation factor)